MSARENYQLELDEKDLTTIRYARLCFERIFDMKGEIYPSHLNLIAKLARLLKFAGDDSDTMCCINCHHWQWHNPEGNGESTGACKALSSQEHSHFPKFYISDKNEWVAYTRSSFMCNQFSRTPSA